MIKFTGVNIEGWFTGCLVMDYYLNNGVEEIK